MFRKLLLIVWKNLIIRKRHWLLTIVEIIIPAVLFTLIAYGRSKIHGLNKVEITLPTYHEPNNLYDIYSHLSVGELNLWYSPHTDFTSNVMRKVQLQFQITGEAVRSFDSKVDLMEHFQHNTSSAIYAVNFEGNNSKELNYEIGIYDKYLTWDTDKLFLPMISDESISSSKYMYKGFAALQLAVDMAFLQTFSPTKKIQFSVQEFPYPPHIADSGINELFIYYLPLITIFSFIFLCPAVLQRVGEEQHSGTTEFMKMVGMKSWMIWLGWFIHALTTNLISIVIVVVLLKVPFWDVSYPPIEFTNGVILFIFLVLYCTAAVTFCFFIATIFHTPTVATVIGILLWMLSYFVPQNALDNDNLDWKYKILLAVFPNMALQYGYSAISVYEMREVGIHWGNIMQPGSGGEDDVTMGNVFLMFVFDSILFMLLTLYIENVKPGDYGIAKSYAFPVTNLKNWVKRRFLKHEVVQDDTLLNRRGVEVGKVPSIQIIDLQKRFWNHLAVDNLNMDIYENEITVLLGHNGAGKTTTMSIITGMIDATNGHVVINGKDIKRDTDSVRQLMGLCPQHNLLFPDLTVIEQLMFFAKLKGSRNPRDDAKDILVKFGIDCKENEMALTLSGGMKRKLCLGMAVIGNSKILILDEPTSGMDPESRRKIWDLLLDYRKTKTILITTHFMEEADVLGDRIAIMDHGQLQCYDTPIRLKIKYNTGYHLSLRFSNISHLEPLSCKEFVKSVTREIKKVIPSANLIRESHDTVVYLLPLDEKTKYREVFDLLENHKNEWHIVNMGLDITTLNDVFLKARLEQNDGCEVDGKLDEGSLMSHNTTCNPMKQFKNIWALIKKRWFILKRKFYWYIPANVVSLCILLLALLSAMSATENMNDGGPELNLNLKAYGKTQVFYGGSKSTNPTIENLREFYKESAIRNGGDPVFEEDVSDGIIQKGIANIAFYKRHMIVAAEFNSTANNDEIIVNALYSPSSYHGLPISINLAMNSVVKALLNESFSIRVKNAPLKQISSDYAPSELSAANVTSLWLILIPLCMTFFISNFIIFPNLEVTTSFLQIQTIAGISECLYWATNCLVDLVLSFWKLFTFFLVFQLINCTVYDSLIFKLAEFEALGAIFAVFIVAALPFAYLFSYRKTVSGGFTMLLMSGIFLGIIPAVVVFALEFSKDDYYMEIAKVIRGILLVTSPQFGLSYVCIKFSMKFVDNFNWEHMDPKKRTFTCTSGANPCCDDDTSDKCFKYKSYFHNSDFGFKGDLLMMLVCFLVYFYILTFLINANWFKKATSCVKYLPHSLYRKSNQVNESAEEKSSDENDSEDKKNPSLTVRNLSKSFGAKHIVKNLQFYVGKNKCLGLLGVNGAGKSTTFKMLTKSLLYDKGDIQIQDGTAISIVDAAYTNKIGYCPQENSLNYYLTASELLGTIAVIKGYSFAEAAKVTEFLLREFGLEPYADKPCHEYSGGNKRKLNTCIAFLGRPNIIMLDEPTSGVDPVSRRKFWNVLSNFKKTRGSSFILCSHSMEECENLCDDIAIMKDGKIEDEGSLLDLKNKFQVGFKITVKLKNDVGDVTAIKDELQRCLSGTLQEEYGGSLEYKVTENKRLSQLFHDLEELKLKNPAIDDYIISQPSLEDVFLTIANKKEGT